MKLAEKNEELPFLNSQNALCAAARIGKAKIKLPNIDEAVMVEFIGTGIAIMNKDKVKNIFDSSHNESYLELEWYQNKFIGTHSFLGEFEIVLAPDKKSIGVVQIVDKVDFGVQMLNSNEFYFDFKFKNFPDFNMKNETPIVNSAIVSGIPPIGSIFKINPDKTEIKVRRGENRSDDNNNYEVVKFDYCDITVLPHRNVGLNLISKDKISADTYKVQAEIANITKIEALFAYFSVIHYKGINVKGDNGFKLLRSDKKIVIEYEIQSEILNRTIMVPFYVGLYKPAAAGGVNFLNIEFEF